ncbi:MAG: hypothetical protein PW844_09605 [Pantoea sp.]|uniref:hypothetical protein n=1 Tax=Pantoea sp. TaxID=69393 RepID=UPI00238EA62C|nr:hypothetical protein [Pantoea sp.]MDE1186721.1 hypothetical protein [Pantoea sp.]
MDNFINALSSLEITRREGNNQTQRPRLQLGNVPAEPVSNKPETSSQEKYTPEIHGEDFSYYMKNHKEEQKISRIFREINFANTSKSPGVYRDIMKFDGDTFIDMNFNFAFFLQKGSQLIRSLIKTEKRGLNWFKFQMGDICWQESIIDGLRHGKRSKMIAVDISNVNLIGGALKNFSISNCDSKIINNIDFTHAFLENITLSDARNQPYKLSNVRFTNMHAINVEFDSVECVNDVYFINTFIDKFIPGKFSQFDGAIFGAYQPRSIGLDPVIFSCEENIHLYLNESHGALFFKIIHTVPNNAVQRDWMEQLLDMFKSEPLLYQVVLSSKSLQESLMTELTKPYLTSSLMVKEFLSKSLLQHHQHALLRDTELAEAYYLLFNTLAHNLPGYEFLIYQVCKLSPYWQDLLYQQAPFQPFLHYLNVNNIDASRCHIFCYPQAGTALCISAEEFQQLINIGKKPESFLLLQHFTGDNRVQRIPSLYEALNPLLNIFPIMQSLWGEHGKKMIPMINFLFSWRTGLNDIEKHRVEEIRHYIISVLERKATQRMDLTSHCDEQLLGKVFSPFFNDNETSAHQASRHRQELIWLMQTHLSLNSYGLWENDQNAVFYRLMIRLLTELSSSRHFGADQTSPLPTRMLAAMLCMDATQPTTSVIDNKTSEAWQQRLLLQDSDTLNDLGSLADQMAAYQSPGFRGDKIDAASRERYPLA